MPVSGLIVATESDEELQVPPPTPGENMLQLPLQIVAGPEIGPGEVLTVTVLVVKHPVGSV